MNHYFIGKLLNPDDAKRLTKGQNYISKNIPTSGKVFNFNTKFAYLGYLSDQDILELQNKLSNVMEALSDKIGPQTATYSKYGVTGIRTTKKSISLLYKNDTITNVVVPYLRNYINQITDDSSDFLPHVSLLRIDANDVNMVTKKDDKGQNILEKTYLPDPNSFIIDSIDIMKGIPVVKRQGAPSKYDDMNMTVINKFKLLGSKSNTKTNANTKTNTNANANASANTNANANTNASANANINVKTNSNKILNTNMRNINANLKNINKIINSNTNKANYKNKNLNNK